MGEAYVGENGSNVAPVIRHARVRAGLSQVELADRAGTPQRAGSL
jgi:ribosome-binding protein aMBF1 (putative translation factor)